MRRRLSLEAEAARRRVLMMHAVSLRDSRCTVFGFLGFAAVMTRDYRAAYRDYGPHAATMNRFRACYAEPALHAAVFGAKSPRVVLYDVSTRSPE